jgi:hypothetical protein
MPSHSRTQEQEYWRKRVNLSMHDADIARLDELAAMDVEERWREPRPLSSWRYWSHKVNRSDTVNRLVEKELARRKKILADEAPKKATTNGSPAKKAATTKHHAKA